MFEIESFLIISALSITAQSASSHAWNPSGGFQLLLPLPFSLFSTQSDLLRVKASVVNPCKVTFVIEHYSKVCYFSLCGICLTL